MKRWSSLAAFAGIVLAVTMVFFASPARSECTTQGQFAVTLAQALGLVEADVTQQDAADALAGIGVSPANGWQPDACLDAVAQAEIEAAILAAINVGTIDGAYSGVVQDVLELVGGPAEVGDGGGPSGSGPSAASRTYKPPVTPHLSPSQR